MQSRTSVLALSFGFALAACTIGPRSIGSEGYAAPSDRELGRNRCEESARNQRRQRHEGLKVRVSQLRGTVQRESTCSIQARRGLRFV
jgi:starvation-inducible outer membrane lipoprotein